MSRVGILLADGFETVEALAVVDVCRRAGFETHMISVMESLDITTGQNIVVKADMFMKDTDMAGYDMLVVPGGLGGTNNLKANGSVSTALTKQHEGGKYVAAICAGPTVLSNLGILKNHKACCYGGMEEQLDAKEISFEDVVVDGNVITSRGMGTSVKFGLAIIAVLENQEKSDKIKNAIMMR